MKYILALILLFLLFCGYKNYQKKKSAAVAAAKKSTTPEVTNLGNVSADGIVVFDNVPQISGNLVVVYADRLNTDTAPTDLFPYIQPAPVIG